MMGRVRCVEISGEYIKEWLAAGHESAELGRRVGIGVGIPQEARLIGASMRVYRAAGRKEDLDSDPRSVCLFFECEAWEPVDYHYAEILVGDVADEVRIPRLNVRMIQDQVQ